MNKQLLKSIVEIVKQEGLALGGANRVRPLAKAFFANQSKIGQRPPLEVLACRFAEVYLLEDWREADELEDGEPLPPSLVKGFKTASVS